MLYVVALIITYLLVNYGLFKTYQSGIWHPFNIKAIQGGPGGDGFTLQRWQEWEKTPEANLLIAGSSHAYRSFHTPWLKEQGISCFNWGSTAQTPLNTYFLLRQLDLSGKNTKWVVMDVFYRLMLDNKGLESCFDLNTNVPYRQGFWEMNFRTGDPTAINHRIATLMDQIFFPLAFKKQRSGPPDHYLGLGYVEHRSEPETDSSEMLKIIRSSRGISVSEKQFEYLKKCTQMLQSNGIKVIWCGQPLPPELVQNDPHFPVIQKRFMSLADSLQVPYWDMSLRGKEFSFFDWHHLDASSALRYSAEFYRFLMSRIFFIPE